jgi:hypothetical protein
MLPLLCSWHHPAKHDGANENMTSLLKYHATEVMPL